jgi:RNA polymerase sigma-70 factor, ECF subfamily
MATHLPNEDSLVAAAQRGNDEAFMALVNHYQQNIFRVALRITGNREDAEDTLQDALLKAYSKLGSFRGGSLFYTWLVRITMNEALMKVRRSKRQGARQTPFDEVWPSIDGPIAIAGTGPADPEAWYSQVELRETLLHALSGISSRLSDAFVLRNVADLSVREIAATLGLSAAAVKSRILRARSRLRQRLRKYPPRRGALSRPHQPFKTPSRGFSGSWTIRIGDGIGTEKRASRELTAPTMTSCELFAALATGANS